MTEQEKVNLKFSVLQETLKHYNYQADPKVVEDKSKKADEIVKLSEKFYKFITK